MKTSQYSAAVLALVSCCAAVPLATAGTAAYWRHEEGPNGGLIAAGNDTVLDSSGNGNHMQTFDPSFTSATYTNLVSPLALRSGLPNNYSLDFGPGGDDAGLNDDNFTTSAKPISSQKFTAMTVEFAFRMDSINGYQALFGKDGKPLGDATGEDDSPVPPLKFLVRGDDFPGGVQNQLFVEFIDGDATLNSDDHFVASHKTIAANLWYHVAFTLNADTAQLWIADETSPYTLLDSISGDFAGATGEVLAAEALGYSTGRGMYNNGVADWADAHIDEIRISDNVLSPNQFLFVAVPEPTAIALLPMVGLLIRRRTLRG